MRRELEGRLVLSRKLRVLIVDDDPDMRLYLRASIERTLHPKPEIVEYGDGESALEAIRSQATDIVLCDVVLPRLGGLELCRAIDADPGQQGLPIVLVTGETETIRSVRDYVGKRRKRLLLEKPFNGQTLMATLAPLLEELAR